MKRFFDVIRISIVVLLCNFSVPQIAMPGSVHGIPNTASSAPDPNHALNPDTVINALRKGGYVVYFRHTATDFSKSDEGMKSYDDCANQRMLSAKGRDMAREIGEHIRALKLPVGEVLASPYCRTMEAAKLAFLRAEAHSEIREKESGDYAGLKRLFARPVPAGTNRWIVGHGNPFRAIAGPPHLAEGEAAVIKPTGTGWIVVARMQPENWAALETGR